MATANAASHGTRSSSVRGCPARILAASAGWLKLSKGFLPTPEHSKPRWMTHKTRCAPSHMLHNGGTFVRLRVEVVAIEELAVEGRRQQLAYGAAVSDDDTVCHVLHFPLLGVTCFQSAAPHLLPQPDAPAMT